MKSFVVVYENVHCYKKKKAEQDTLLSQPTNCNL